MKVLILAALTSLATFAAVAQTDYPARPIKLISTSAPGSAGDVLARMLGEKMGASMKGTFVIDNRPGAGGLVAVEATAKAPPDGYTIILGVASAFVIMPAIRPNMPYNALKDFTYMGQVGTAPGVLVAAIDFPANNLQELIALAKTRPDLQYASWGIGSTGHLCGEMLNQRAGIRIQHIPYKAVAQIQTDLYGGHIRLAQVDGGSAPAMVRSGKVKALGTCTGRHVALPNVRSYEEEGISDAEKRIGQFRFGLYAPAGTPKAIADRIEAALKSALDLPDVKSKMLEMGIQPAFLPGETVYEMTAREIDLWRKLAETASIKLD